MNKLVVCCAFIGSIGFCGASQAHLPTTHELLTHYANSGSVLSIPSKLQDLGLRGLATNDPRQKFLNSVDRIDKSVWLTIDDLIKFGSRYEDERGPFQALRHFYDPKRGLPLTIELPSIVPTAQTSPDWALEDIFDFGDDQPFSYRKARQYFFNSLTSSTEYERNYNWGRTFQTIGHIVHHVQDMAHPQHVGDDPHCDNPICLVVKGLYNPSFPETWASPEGSTRIVG